MKKTLCFAFATAILVSALAPTAFSQVRGGRRPEAEARVRAEAQRERRIEIQEQLETATAELEGLTKILVEEVAEIDGYTISLQVLEASDRIEDLARQIEDLAKTINRRAQGR